MRFLKKKFVITTLFLNIIFDFSKIWSMFGLIKLHWTFSKIQKIFSSDLLESRQFKLSYQRFQISSGNIKGRIDFLEISKTIGVLFIADLQRIQRMEREEQYIHYLFIHLRAVYLGIWKATWGFFWFSYWVVEVFHIVFFRSSFKKL